MKWTNILAVGAAMMMTAGFGQVAANAQGGAPKFLKASAKAAGPVTPGKPFTLIVSLTVEKPYHIQANPPKEGYIATVVDIVPTKGFKIGKVTYPKASQAIMGGEKLPVYVGAVKISATVSCDGSVKPGKTSLPISIRYQGCNETMCYPPGTLQTTASVVVGGKKAELRPRHTSVALLR